MKFINALLIPTFFFLFSCGGEEQADSSDSSDHNETAVDETEEVEAIEEIEVEEVSEQADLATMIVGDWEYVESITTIGEESMSMRAAHNWVMNYKDDGTFYEMQQLIEGGEEYVAEGTFTIEGETLKREGLFEVDVLELTEEKLHIGSLGSSMVFKKV
jgi:hypothetical protein